MPLSHEHLGSKIPAKIKIYTLTRAELLITLCYEIPRTEGQESLLACYLKEKNPEIFEATDIA